MYFLARYFLFFFDAETAHHLSLGLLSKLIKLPFGKTIVRLLFGVNEFKNPTECMGLTFKNDVGLAAGFDKNAEYIDVFETLGFGFVEVGTTTPKPQPGNDLPRLFRLKKDEAIINRMGFNNQGVDVVAQRLKMRKKNDLIIGGNIGKNKLTEDAISDYKICFEKLYGWVDYFVINVSSPNTEGLRSLQAKDKLHELLKEIAALNNSKEKPAPILVKIAPDLSDEEIEDVADVVNSLNINGVVCTNTTISRADVTTSQSELDKIGNGGLSGKPLLKKSNEVLKLLKSKLAEDKIIIGVGGVLYGSDVQTKKDLGASLVQLYSGFIYRGPLILREYFTLVRMKTT